MKLIKRVDDSTWVETLNPEGRPHWVLPMSGRVLFGVREPIPMVGGIVRWRKWGVDSLWVGATVALVDASAIPFGTNILDIWGAIDGGAGVTVVSTTVTDANGHYEFDLAALGITPGTTLWTVVEPDTPGAEVENYNGSWNATPAPSVPVLSWDINCFRPLVIGNMKHHLTGAGGSPTENPIVPGHWTNFVYSNPSFSPIDLFWESDWAGPSGASTKFKTVIPRADGQFRVSEDGSLGSGIPGGSTKIVVHSPNGNWNPLLGGGYLLCDAGGSTHAGHFFQNLQIGFPAAYEDRWWFNIPALLPILADVYCETW